MPEAIEDLGQLRAFIAQDDPEAARRIALRTVAGVKTILAANPEIGRPGRVPGTREFVIARTPFIVPYRVRGATLEILRVDHGSRRWPDRF
jgi:toxin ParE1/3/4